MQHAKKMLLVPYVPTRPDRDIEQLNKMDNEMSQILNNKSVSIFEKVQQYNQILNKYIDKNESIDKNVHNQHVTHAIVQKNELNDIKSEPDDFLEKKSIKNENDLKLVEKLKNILHDSDINTTRMHESNDFSKRKNKKRKLSDRTPLIKTRKQVQKNLKNLEKIQTERVSDSTQKQNLENPDQDIFNKTLMEWINYTNE